MPFEGKSSARADQPPTKRRLAASVKRAENLEREGKVEEAAAVYERIVESSPGDPRVLVHLALLRRGQGRIDEAVQLASSALSLQGRDNNALELLLQIYLETGQYDEVITRAKSVIKFAPRSMYAREMMGAAYLQLGQLDKALQMTNELIHLDPTDAGNHFKRAILFQQKGDLGKAIREFTRVVDLEPEGEMADDARDAITALDSYQLRQIIALAIEDRLFRAKLLRDAETSAVEKGFFLSPGGVYTLKQVDFESLGDSLIPGDLPTYH